MEVTFQSEGIEARIVRTASALPARITDAYRTQSARVISSLASAGLNEEPNKYAWHFIDSGGREIDASPVFDLAAAVQVWSRSIQRLYKPNVAYFGELGLDGKVLPVRGAYVIAKHARDIGMPVVCSVDNAAEATAAGADVAAVRTLREALAVPTIAHEVPAPNEPTTDQLSFADLRRVMFDVGTFRKAVMEGKKILLVGETGCGKTAIVRRIPSILPRMATTEVDVLSSVYSAAGLLSKDRPQIEERPLRAPHHTVSLAGMLGSSKPARPGEVSLATYGVLYLDDVTEFPKETLEATMSAVDALEVMLAGKFFPHVRLPAFPLSVVGSADRCGCGCTKGKCRCDPYEYATYQQKLAYVKTLFDVVVDVSR